MRTLHQSRIADVRDPAVQERLRSRHPHSPSPVTAIDATDLPLPMDVNQAEVLYAVHRLNQNSASAPDRMLPRLLHLLANTRVSEAIFTGISLLRAVVRRLANGDLPDRTIPLISSATPVSIQPRPDKICSIANGTAMWRLVEKALLSQALNDIWDYFAPLRLASGIPSGLDSIFHKVQRRVRDKGDDDGYMLLSVDGHNAFNLFSRL
eukprot:GFKZ01001059.1.p1 GENE.GFKZ01001059.1~~GFKZ01001059.1.p1  ORF type:complete len:208 (+),score=9.10 GFKZ01001059.1:387-1010(+)